MTTVHLVPDMPHHEYLALDRVSASRLEMFLRSPKEYHAALHGGGLPQKSSASMDFGTAFHLLLLDPDQYHSRVVVRPDFGDLRTSAGKKRRDDWDEENPPYERRLILSEDQVGDLKNMADAVADDPSCRRIFDGQDVVKAHLESTILFDYHDQPCKARPDVILERRPARSSRGVAGEKPSPIICVDVKTAAEVNPLAFARSIANYGYHRQAFFYRQALRLLYNREVFFRWVVVGTKAPWHVMTAMPSYEMDGVAEREVNDAFAELRQCADEGEWNDRWHGDTVVMSLPRWAATDRPITIMEN